MKCCNLKNLRCRSLYLKKARYQCTVDHYHEIDSENQHTGKLHGFLDQSHEYCENILDRNP